VDDGVSTVLRATPSMNRTPTWSPDGSAIAFIVEGESPTAQLALIGPDGRDGRSLGNPAWDDRFLAWLP
jgi:Tol biopolymer transport system component